MPGGCFQSIDLASCGQALNDLHERVSTGYGRIEITRVGCDDTCVLISKAELETLEKAIELLTQSEHYQAMCAQLNNIASESMRPNGVVAR
jgi:PHD/YefM family antitoxin component YafN of YafNO toxin-antitoxin module